MAVACAAAAVAVLLPQQEDPASGCQDTGEWVVLAGPVFTGTSSAVWTTGVIRIHLMMGTSLQNMWVATRILQQPYGNRANPKPFTSFLSEHLHDGGWAADAGRLWAG